METERYYKVEMDNWPTQLRFIEPDEVKRFIDGGCRLTPLVAMTPERVEALSKAVSALWDTQNLEWMAAGDVLFAMLDEAREAQTDEPA